MTETKVGSGSLIWAWASIAGLVLGAFGPWAKAPFGTSISGLDGSNDGWIIIGLAGVAAAVLTWIQRKPGRRVFGRALLIFVAAGVSVLISYHDRSNVSGEKLLQVGWGLNLTLAAAVSLGVSAIAVHASHGARGSG